MNSNKGFENTPSFYKDEETFTKYLGQTSYYLGLQSAVTKICGLTGAKAILDLGSGTGDTTFRLAKSDPSSLVIGVDYRDSMTQIAVENRIKRNIRNTQFVTADMTGVWDRVKEAEMVVMLYSFHHIEDPVEKKIAFLEKCYTCLSKGAHLCIAETFLPDVAVGEMRLGKSVALWGARAIEAYASTFWAALGAISKEGVEMSKEIGRFAQDHERLAGRLVEERDNEYLVSLSWLINAAQGAGFKVVLSEPINSVGDAVVVLQPS